MNEKVPSIADRKRMSFRAAEDGAGLPAALQWGELDEALRLELWDAFHELLVGNLDGGNTWFTVGFQKLLARILRVHANVPIDEAIQAVEFLSGATEAFKPIILEQPCSEVLDLIQCTLRESSSPRFTGRMIAIFNDPRSPYDLVGPPPTIVPKGLDIEGTSVANDLETIESAGLMGARSHLLAAAAALNRGANRDAIRESIHAVESAAKRISGREKEILSDALDLLEKEKGLHPALKQALTRLYGYTSDEEGIRHALLESDNKDVGIDEALFMFSACTAFASYLARKFPDKQVV